jgi:hypothetical protein
VAGLAEYDGPEGWVQGQRHGTFMTREELLAFFDEYLALLRRYGHSREDAPEGRSPSRSPSWRCRSPSSRFPARRQPEPPPGIGAEYIDRLVR